MVEDIVSRANECMKSNMELMYHQLNLRHGAGVILGVSLHSAPDSQSASSISGPLIQPKSRLDPDKEEAEPRHICSNDGINVVALQAYVIQLLSTWSVGDTCGTETAYHSRLIRALLRLEMHCVGVAAFGTPLCRTGQLYTCAVSQSCLSGP